MKKYAIQMGHTAEGKPVFLQNMQLTQDINSAHTVNGNKDLDNLRANLMGSGIQHTPVEVQTVAVETQVEVIDEDESGHDGVPCSDVES